MTEKKHGLLASLFGALSPKPISVDPWSRRARGVPPSRFSHGCRHEWAWYFDGISNVRAKSVRDVCRWLRRCKYVHDRLLFQEDDFWQHPVTFETTRKGDCEDHALWAWRKLAELEMPAELVIGKSQSGDPRHHGWHAWVIFERPDGKRYVMETTAKKDQKQMILAVNRARRIYQPAVSVDERFQTWVYGQ